MMAEKCNKRYEVITALQKKKDCYGQAVLGFDFFAVIDRGLGLFGLPEPVFVWLMDILALAEKSLSSPLTGRRGQKHFVV